MGVITISFFHFCFDYLVSTVCLYTLIVYYVLFHLFQHTSLFWYYSLAAIYFAAVDTQIQRFCLQTKLPKIWKMASKQQKQSSLSTADFLSQYMITVNTQQNYNSLYVQNLVPSVVQIKNTCCSNAVHTYKSPQTGKCVRTGVYVLVI